MHDPAIVLTETRLATLRDLADMIVPRTDKMPSASDIDLCGGPLGQAIGARPDLADPLAALLDRLAGVDPESALARLSREDRDAFSLIMQIVAGAYYMDCRVRAALGYDGQRRMPLDPSAASP